MFKINLSHMNDRIPIIDLITDNILSDGLVISYCMGSYDTGIHRIFEYNKKRYLMNMHISVYVH